MHVSWSFLDKRIATVSAIKARSDMEFIIEHTDDDIIKVRERMEGSITPSLSGMPGAHNTSAGEERMAACLDEIDVLKERYRQAMEYMDWFVPAWRQLSDDERFVLDAFYVSGGNSALSLICSTYRIERSSAYNRKNKALEHLESLLFGRM